MAMLLCTHFPLIADMTELEANAGRLLRKTKFISIADIDSQAASQAPPVFTSGKEHNFRISKFDMNRCEVNFFLLFSMVKIERQKLSQTLLL